MNKNYFFAWMLLLAACSSSTEYQYWETSKFHIVPEALQDNEEIKLLYSSRGPKEGLDLDYYIHLVVVSQKTGDTVNVLTYADNGFSREDGNKVWNYFGPDNLTTKAFVNAIMTEKLSKASRMDTAAPELRSKVARDPKFDDIADNNYPTVFGALGQTSKME